MKIREDVELGQHSHVGMARTENQDFFGYWEPDDDREFDLRGRLAVVCDGMGGHSGGEIASRMAVKAIIEAYKSSTEENVSEALRAAIESANRTVYGEGVRLKELAGMGTTVTTVVQRRDMVYFGQVGDSRAYLIRGGQMKQMTKDHSLVQQLVDELLDQRVVLGHLLHLTAADQIGAAVADLAEVDHVAALDHGRDRSPHPGQLLEPHALAVDGPVRALNGRPQGLGDVLLRRGLIGLDDRLDRHAARDLAAGVAAHAVAYDRQPTPEVELPVVVWLPVTKEVLVLGTGHPHVGMLAQLHVFADLHRRSICSLAPSGP